MELKVDNVFYVSVEEVIEIARLGAKAVMKNYDEYVKVIFIT